MGKKKIMKEYLMYFLFGDRKRSMLILSAIVFFGVKLDIQ